MMKTSFILMLMYLGIGHLFAQPFQSVLGNVSTSWKIASCNLYGISSDSLYANDDTIIDNHVYKKVYDYTSYNSLIGWLREDIITGKVWFCPVSNYSDSTEFLVMDMNLSAADSFYFHYAPNTSGWTAVDTIYYFDSKKHIELNATSSWNDKVTFIEGVGPNITLFYAQYNWLNTCPYQLCNYKDSQQGYTTNNSQFDECNIISSTNQYIEQKPKRLSIMPNPITNTALISFENPGNSEFLCTLYDSQGKTVYQSITRSTGIIIEKRNFISGLYYIAISNGKIHYCGKAYIN